METPSTQLTWPREPTAVLPPPVCPRCHAGLSTIRHPVRREGRMTALLCPSVICGYKLIVPA